MERDGLGLDLALLDVDLVTAQNDRDILAHADEVTYIDRVRRVPEVSCEWPDLRCQLGTFL